MNLLFSNAGLLRLNAIVKPGMLCVFDFDGTLSPIVAQPDQATIPPPTLHRLIKLSRLTPVGIITGRSVEDVSARLKFRPDYLIGNHGMEGMPGWPQQKERYQAICDRWAATLSAALRDPALFDKNIQIENKGYSLSVHYRMAGDHAKTEKDLYELFGTLKPSVRVISGRCVFNLLPRGASNKGIALQNLIRISGVRSTLYVGDDVTDEDAFRLRRHDLLSIRVEPAPTSAAEYCLQRYAEIPALLDKIIFRLTSQMK